MTRPALRWTIISSAEQRAGRYTIVSDPHDPDVQVLVDGQAMFPGFGSIKEAKGWCERHHLGVTADHSMLDGALQMIPTIPED